HLTLRSLRRPSKRTLITCWASLVSVIVQTLRPSPFSAASSISNKEASMKLFTVLLLSILAVPSAVAQNKPGWRSATMDELKAVLPARAPVQKERIETEMRTASGIVNSNGKVIAGVVLIT